MELGSPFPPRRKKEARHDEDPNDQDLLDDVHAEVDGDVPAVDVEGAIRLEVADQGIDDPYREEWDNQRDSG